MHDSQLVPLIARDTALHSRIEALIRKRLAEKQATRSEAELLRTPPIDTIAWQVTGNGSMLPAVRAKLDAQPDGEVNVAKAIADGITDGDLTWLIEQEITCLQSE